MLGIVTIAIFPFFKNKFGEKGFFDDEPKEET